MSKYDFPVQSADSVLFVTLDSCRYDTFLAAKAPVMKRVAPLFEAQAPSHFTYGSHAAMFMGFTPGVANIKKAILNPKFSKLFKLVGAGFAGKGGEAYELQGRNIIEGFANEGFATIGAAAMGWFDPATLTGRNLTESFTKFFYAGSYYIRQQLKWLSDEIARARQDGYTDQFVFLNVGETHVPYYFDGAPWEASDNPCQPFQAEDRSDVCRERQRLCCEFVDAELEALIASFAGSTILICGDHGDCWGEDGLWEHGISHPATLTVPLVARVKGSAIGASTQPRA